MRAIFIFLDLSKIAITEERLPTNPVFPPFNNPYLSVKTLKNKSFNVVKDWYVYNISALLASCLHASSDLVSAEGRHWNVTGSNPTHEPRKQPCCAL